MQRIFYLLILQFMLAAPVRSQMLLYMNYNNEEMHDAADAKGNKNFDTYTSYLQGLTGISVLPNFNLNFNSTDRTGKHMWMFKGFTAGTKTDSSIQDKSLRLFYQEASKFGFTLTSCQKLLSNKNDLALLCFNAEASYLGKEIVDSNLKDNSSEKVLIHIAHVKAGIEAAIDPTHLSLFYNLNYGVPLTKRQEFQRIFSYNRYPFLFHDVGIMGRVSILDGDETQSGPGMDMYLTLGGIIHTGDTRSLSNSTDLIAPYIRLGCKINIKNFKK
jgi:hypothetical protein